MRILAIRGRNLASLAGDFAVEFAEGPLADAGIFAITGPTGAGKSTLLDAMSLALFDEIPRLADLTGREGNLTDSEISIKDSRGILRHGAGDGHAELDFVACDGKSYRSRWSVRRARGKADGKVQQASIDLECLETGERMGGRKRETLSEIERLIGLNAEQFGRAVVLAQGEFEAFIKASGDERAQLLEKLTGASIYTLLGKKAFEKAKAVRFGYEGLTEQIARQEGLGDEERAALQAVIAEGRIDREAKAKAHESLQVASRWFEGLAGLTEKVAQGRRVQLEAQQALAEAAPREVALKRRRRALDHAGHWRQLAGKRNEGEQARQALAERTEAEQEAQEAETAAQTAEREASAALNIVKARRAQAEPELAMARDADRAIKEAEKRREETAATLAGCRTAHEQTQAKATETGAAHNEARNNRAELEQWREEHAGLERLAREEFALAEDLSAFAACRGQRRALEDKRDGSKTDADKAQDALDYASRALSMAETEYVATKSALENARKEAPDAYALQHLERAREVLLELQTRQGVLQQARVREVEAESTLAETRELIGKIKSERSQRKRDLVGVQAALPALEARKDEAERARTRSLAASSAGVVAMREALKDGEPCPVCGATEHRLDAVQVIFGEAAEEARVRAAETDEALELARRRCTVLETETDAGTRNLAKAEDHEERQAHTLAARVSEREEREAAFAAAIQKTDIDPGVAEDDLLVLMMERLPEIDAERERLRGAAGRLDATRREEEDKRAARETAREAREQRLEMCREAGETLAGIVRQLDEVAGQQERLAAGIDRAVKDLIDWRALSDPADWLAERAREWRGKNEESQVVAAQIPILFEEWTADKAAAAAAAREFDKARDADNETQVELGRARSVRKALLGGRPAGELEAELTQALEKAEATHDKARESLVHAQTECVRRRSRREEVGKALSRLKADLAGLQEAFERALSATDLSVEEVVEAAETGSEALEKEETQLHLIHNALAAAKAALAQRAADLAAHEQTDRPDTDPETLASELEEAKATLDDAEAELMEHEFRLRRDDEVRQQTAKLRAELAEARDKARVWEELADLIGDANGKTFRNFAQSLTLDRLLEFANDRLAGLKPRYSLQRASGGDMLMEVIDNDMGGQVRGLQNLSGGERFLVSLALALGLAEMSTGRGVKIESLFIDEGFGALDSASLGQAVAVLEHLHAQGRRVGVISHVEDLKERIPVKIEITPISGGRSEISISTD